MIETPVTNCRVLLVDDDTAVRRSCSAYFERQGHSTLQAESSTEGIRLWKEHHPDVAIVDMAIPDISGLDVLEELRKDGAIVLTTFGGIRSATEAIRRGAEPFLTKPMEIEHLGHAVEWAVEKAKLRRENAELRSLVRTDGGRRVARAMIMAVVGFVALWMGTVIGRSDGAVATRTAFIAVDPQP